jgi:hypothetical protein
LQSWWDYNSDKLISAVGVVISVAGAISKNPFLIKIGIGLAISRTAYSIATSPDPTRAVASSIISIGLSLMNFGGAEDILGAIILGASKAYMSYAFSAQIMGNNPTMEGLISSMALGAAIAGVGAALEGKPLLKLEADVANAQNANFASGSPLGRSTINDKAYYAYDPDSGNLEGAIVVGKKLSSIVTSFHKAVHAVKNMSISEIAHLSMDVAGNIPLVGNLFDIANAGLYLYEGDHLNAGFAAAAAIPIAGLLATAGKYGVKLLKGLKAARGGNYAYRSLTAADAASLRAGKGLLGKAPNGAWSFEQHLIHGSSSKAWLNNPWIATSTDIKIARSFSSGNGLVRINLSKLPAGSMQRGWMSLPRSSAGYHYSIWQREVSIFQHIPQNAIKIIK